MVLVERTFQVRWTREKKFLGLVDVLEVVLRAQPVQFVRVRVRAGARIKGNLDLLEGLLGPLHDALRRLLCRAQDGRKLVHQDLLRVRRHHLLPQFLLELS